MLEYLDAATKTTVRQAFFGFGLVFMIAVVLNGIGRRLRNVLSSKLGGFYDYLVMPVVVLNPAFFPKDEIAALRGRRGNVFEFGKGANAPFNAPYVERTDRHPFPGMPETDSCYFTRPLSENVPWPIQYDMLADRVNWMTSPYGVLTKASAHGRCECAMAGLEYS